ncbi:MAG: DUF1295 domain-containing protein [Planctomycetota bacterium]|nr:DUF1295 domain-containing protein [Planctomycetota bacterium]
MPLSSMLLVTAIVIGMMMLLLWAVSLPCRDASLVDRFWGFGFVLVVWVRFTLHGVNQEPQSLLLPFLVTLWGLRLSGYLTWRNWGQSEDFRYRAMRERHGERFPWVSLLTVFTLQGVVMWVVALPLLLRQDAPLQWNLWQMAGVLVWFIGFAFESIGDLQMARFKSRSENQGQVMDQGLWRFTRHPNYFGNALVWWGLTIVAITGIEQSWILISPAVMTLCLLYVSGVPILESTLAKRTAGYREYIQRTSRFLPWPPRAHPNQLASGSTETP